MLGEDTEPDLVKNTFSKSLQGFLLPLCRLQMPYIAGGSHRIIRRAVLIGKMPGIRHPYRAVAALIRRFHPESASLFFSKAAAHRKGILSLEGRHKSHPVNPFPVIKPIAGNGFLIPAKFCPYFLLRKGISLFRPFKCNLKHVPSFHCTLIFKFFHFFLSFTICRRKEPSVNRKAPLTLMTCTLLHTALKTHREFCISIIQRCSLISK